MTEQESTAAPAAGTPKRNKPNTPAADLDLKDLTEMVVEKWGQNPQITLLWTQQPALAEILQQFATTLDQRLITGSGRAPVTGSLSKWDKTIQDHTDYLKTYLKDKYGKDSYMDYFGQFGIVKEGATYKFPSDRNKRKSALKQTIAAIQAQGFEDKTYGLAFWQEISAQYEQLVDAAVQTDSSVAALVSQKKQLRAQILRTLNSLIYIIKGNYPDDYQSVMRAWGFQKEKY
jgi:hypothetical protein